MNRRHPTRSVLFLLLTLLFYSQCKKEEVTPDCNLSAICNHTNTTIGNNGTATVVPSGNHRAATYLWSNGKTTATITGLATGTYTVTVTENPSCTFVCNVNIQEQVCNLSATAIGTDVSCNSGTDGTATATATGNLVPVTYLWSNGATTASILGLTAGTYTVTVTETPICTAVASYTVTEPTLLDAACNKTDATTIGGNQGTATVNGTGGTAPYTYLWSNDLVIASITGLTAGTYSVTVTDLNGCTANCMLTVQEPGCNLSATATGTDVSCNGGNDGTATATATGNLVPVTYLWSNSSTTASITGLTAGTYTVTVTEVPTCTAVTSYTVTESSSLTVSAVATDALCNGGNGSILVSASGGTSPYSGEGTFSEVAGTYAYTVSDANGCSATASATVAEPTILVVICNHTDATSIGGADGTASVYAYDGVSPYTYLWSNGEITANITGLIAGTYSVTVTDANGCTVNCSTTVFD
jgi:hypothetical protein